MTEPFYNATMRLRISIVAALALFCTACTEPAVPRYAIPTPTSPSPIPTPTPAPVPTPTGSILTVSLQVGPISPVAGLSAALTAVTTTVNKQPSTYVWTFGDGAVDTSTSSTPFFVSTFHTFGRAGIYDARVDLTDGDGRTASGFAHVTVQAAPPPPAPPAPTPTPTPTVSTLVATLTCTAGNATITKTTCNLSLTYGGAPLGGGTVTAVVWDWSDGLGTDTAGTTAVQQHQYLTPGTFTVLASVTATTIDGPKTASASKPVTIP